MKLAGQAKWFVRGPSSSRDDLRARGSSSRSAALRGKESSARIGTEATARSRTEASPSWERGDNLGGGLLLGAVGSGSHSAAPSSLIERSS